jgi:uncharacterized membrane protein YdcZ (DUF606 family)
MMLAIVALSVALVSFIVYALERRSKQQPIVWGDALKLSLFGGLVSTGVVFASTADVSALAEALPATPAVTDMFVGTPSF